MNLIKITGDMLPNMPVEVIEMFIVPLNEHPSSIFDDKPEGRWFYHFGGLSIEEFSELRWKRATRVLDGCHRLAAAFSLDIRDSIPLDAWVGE